MKILWFSHRDIKNPRSGGAERTIYEVGKRISLKGNIFIWISASWNNKYSEEIMDNIIIKREKNNSLLHLKVPEIIKREKPDFIVDDMGHAVPFLSENFTKIPGIVFFHHLHRRSLKGQVNFPMRMILSGLEAFYPVFYRKWHFITESNSSINDLINLGIQNKRIIKIPPGVNTELFRPLKKTEFPSIVYFGGFRDYKRPWEVIYAVNNLIKKCNNIMLYMIGSGPSLNKTMKIYNDLDIKNNVIFLGRINNNDLSNIVGSSWLNVHTSITEGFGFSILEASSAGTPTIAYDVPGVRDVIIQNKNGFTVKDGSIDDLTKKIDNFISNYDNRWINSSRSIALEYSWDKTAELWLTNIKKTLEIYK
ncbi:glycosyltransferase family 4 protein [Oxyplasma meridianum]|uniref:Glycosyltransferase family 4 protein n=1 Tax=Oxyplasma meridianum TaxID=3073602 RepID=A0AAX4NFL1_9ARCH